MRNPEPDGPVTGGEPACAAEDRGWMQAALELAEGSIGLASPNPPVGCVIVRDGRVVGRGRHEFQAKDHAEVVALRAARGGARGATVYLTLEPCTHLGRTPPCAPRLIEAAPGRVVVAREDPNPLVAGAGVRALRKAGIRVDQGLMAAEAGRLIEPFAVHVRHRRPLVALKAGMSLDGRIGTGTGLDRGITGAVSAEFGQRLRLEMDAILVGVNTILADNPRLTYRGASPRRRPLCRVILDSRLRTPPTARVLQGAPDVPLLIFCAAEARAARRLRLEGQGAEVVAVPRRGTGLSLKRVLAELGKRRLLGLLVEGGGEVHWRFVRERLADKFYFLIAPIILGGRKSIPCVGGMGYARIVRAPRWAITSNRKLGEDLLVEAYPRFSRSILSPWRS